MVRIKGHNNLEKDEYSGAVILAPELTKSDLQIDLLVRKVNLLCEQNKEILARLDKLETELHK